MVVEDKKLGNLEVVVDIRLDIDKKMFENLFFHYKAKYELEVKAKKKQIAKVYRCVKEITNVFQTIKFDILRSFFYNETEETINWSTRKSRIEGNPEWVEAGRMRKKDCDCCNVV